MQNFRSKILLAGVLLAAPLMILAAGLFPDVPDGHPFKGEIESLARSSVIKGNPDGNYYPEKLVNRAEFLKMLYVATGRHPKPIYAKCFADVEVGSWYEAYVCDAASRENGFVQGYPNSIFKPGNPVTRTEGLKMVFMLFNVTVPDISQNDKDLIKFVDISTSAWYSKYVSAAYVNGLLPIAGQVGARFFPDKPLNRGEAAAFIFNGQQALDRQHEADREVMKSSVSSSSARSAPTDTGKNVKFPFTDTDQFKGKRPVAYMFTLSAQTGISLQTSITGYYPSDITCRLYLLKDDGFTDEYYLGVQQNGVCTIRVNAKPGTYQLQMQPTLDYASYVVTAKTEIGDNNDGFSDAVVLKSHLLHTDVLTAGDLFDWYQIIISKDQTATIDVTASEKLSCIIYTPSSVDQYGFKGPECGKPYDFKAGDPVMPYYIGIGRLTGDLIHRVPYTVKFGP